MKIILASQSPRRHELLASMEIGIEFTTFHPEVDETLMPNEPPEGYALRLAHAKASKAASTLGQGLFIGADTVVTIDGAIFGKPRDARDAEDILSCLSGETHSVITAYSVLDSNTGKEILKAVETSVTVKELTETEIEQYVATGEPMDKAGAYAIQGKGKFMVEKIEGSFSNVVGLPTEELLESLREFIPTLRR
jgi:septum formation protein